MVGGLWTNRQTEGQTEVCKSVHPVPPAFQNLDIDKHFLFFYMERKKNGQKYIHVQVK